MAAIAIGLHLENDRAVAGAAPFDAPRGRPRDGAHVHAVDLLAGNVERSRRAWRNRVSAEARSTDVPMAYLLFSMM